MKQRVYMFACGYDRYENKFGYFAYANRLDKETQKEIEGKRITVKTSSYPFYFNGKCVPIEFHINVGIETTTGAIAKKIMSRLRDYYIVHNAKMQALWNEISSYNNTNKKVWIKQTVSAERHWFLCYSFDAPYLYFVAYTNIRRYLVLFVYATK